MCFFLIKIKSYMTFPKIICEKYFERQKLLKASLRFVFVTLGRVALDKNSCEFIISIDKKLSYNRKTLFFIVLKMIIWWIHQIQIKAMNKWQREENKWRRMTSNTEHMFHFSNNHRHNSNHSHECWHKIESKI